MYACVYLIYRLLEVYIYMYIFLVRLIVILTVLMGFLVFRGEPKRAQHTRYLGTAEIFG